MSAVEELKAYLNSDAPNYVEGVNLLLAYGNKPATCDMLLQKQDRTRLERLLNTLYLSLQEAEVPHNGSIDVKVNVPTFATNSQIVNKLHESHYKWLTEKLRSELKEIEHLKQQLFHIGRNSATGKPKALSKADIKERRIIAQRLVGDGGLNQSSIKLMQEINYMKKHGEPMPVVEPVAKLNSIPDNADLYQLKENSRKLVAKLKKKIEKATAALAIAKGIAKTDLSNDIAKWRLQLSAENELLNQYKGKLNERK